MANLDGFRILIVEDEALIAEEIKDRLQEMGAVVVGITDTAEQAVAMAANEKPDIALMDIRLKGEGDGIDAATEIYNRFGVPAVFLTAYSDRATIDRVVGVGQFGYLTKPFREQDLAATISLAYHHHRVEVGLRESQLSLREIFASAADGLMAADVRQEVRYMNSAAENLTGLGLDDALDRPIDEVLRLKDEATGEEVTGLIDGVIHAAEPPVRDRELLLIDGDGGETPIALSVMPVRDGETMVGAAISLRSLIERREQEAAKEKTERALRDQRLLLGTLIDGLPEMFFAIDADQTIVVVNHALLDTLGLKRHEVLGKRLEDVFNGGGLADVHRQAGTAIDKGSRITCQQRAWMGPEGKLRWFSFSFMPLAGGGDIALACTAVDVTDRKRLEDELLEATNREQRRLGRDLHDTLGQELASLSLLISNLERKIAAVIPDLLPDTAEIRETIVHAVDSMRATARGLAPTDLRHGGLLLALQKLAARCARVRNIQCRFTGTDEELPPLDPAVAEHIYRFAQEATSNAARHADPGTISIALYLRNADLVLAVEDDGRGMHGVRDRRGGLGLRIMEYRAHKIGGSVDFEQPPAGTRVVLRVPLTVLRAIRVEGARSAASEAAWEKLPPLESPN